MIADMVLLSNSQSEIVSPIHHWLKPMAETQNWLQQVGEAALNVFEHVIMSTYIYVTSTYYHFFGTLGTLGTLDAIFRRDPPRKTTIQQISYCSFLKTIRQQFHQLAQFGNPLHN
jgi:hypothetical protein